MHETGDCHRKTLSNPLPYLALIALCACSTPEPCAEGFGMDAMGQCMPLANQNPASDDTSSPEAPLGDSIGDRLVFTAGTFQAMPLTWDDAGDQGYIQTTECSENMGLHAISEIDGTPVLELIYDATGAIIGVGIVSQGQEASPPWDPPSEGSHNPTEIHIFFRDNTTACDPESTSVAGSIGDRVIITWDSYVSLPLSLSSAEEDGWIRGGDCEPNEGVHAIWPGTTDSGEQWPLELTFNSSGRLIGLEMVSTTEQPTGPWEQMDGEGNPWTIHMWFSDPALACED